MNTLFPLLFAALAGLGSPVQAAANGGLNKALGNVVVATTIIYAVGLVALLLASPLILHATEATGTRGVLARVANVPWWAYLGGLMNLLFVLAATLTTPQLGAGGYILTTAVCALVSGLLLDHFGLLGLESHPISALRLIGAALAVSGIFVFSKG